MEQVYQLFRPLLYSVQLSSPSATVSLSFRNSPQWVHVPVKYIFRANWVPISQVEDQHVRILGLHKTETLD